MDAVQTCMEGKTILCGHWHSSYGHWKYEHSGSEFDEDADFSPYYDLFHSETFPSIKIGKRYYVTPDAFEKWLQDYEGKEYYL